MSINRRNDCWSIISIRIGVLGMILSLIWIVYINYEYCWQLLEQIYQIYRDILEFGYDKISNYHKGNSISVVNKHDDYMRKLNNENLDD